MFMSMILSFIHTCVYVQMLRTYIHTVHTSVGGSSNSVIYVIYSVEYNDVHHPQGKVSHARPGLGALQTSSTLIVSFPRAGNIAFLASDNGVSPPIPNDDMSNIYPGDCQALALLCCLCINACGS